jgi:hypothetical protein
MAARFARAGGTADYTLIEQQPSVEALPAVVDRRIDREFGRAFPFWHRRHQFEPRFLLMTPQIGLYNSLARSA